MSGNVSFSCVYDLRSLQILTLWNVSYVDCMGCMCCVNWFLITAKRYFSWESVVCPKKGTILFLSRRLGASFLTAESVEGTALALQSVDDIHGGDGLSLGVLGVGDSITDDIF